MCDIAPFGMECIHEGYKDKLFSCSVFHLEQAFNNLYLSIPIVKHFINPYRCPYEWQNT